MYAVIKTGGKQYKDLEAALDRLQGTRIKILNLTGGSRREVVAMPLIQTFKVISKTTTGNIDQGNRSPPPPCHNRQAMPHGISRMPMRKVGRLMPMSEMARKTLASQVSRRRAQ